MLIILSYIFYILFLLCIIGIVLVFVNLALDGYTNNQQDNVFEKHKPTPVEMMKYLNFCQFIYLFVFIALQCIYYAIMTPDITNEGIKGLLFLYYYETIGYDVLIFCFCAAIGQLFVFLLMEEFGALVWICISVTRKLVTVLVSVVVFNHQVLQIQWLGMISVFIGIILDSYMSYVTDKQKNLLLAKDKGTTINNSEKNVHSISISSNSNITTDTNNNNNNELSEKKSDSTVIRRKTRK